MTRVSQADLVNAAILGKVVSFPTDTVPALAVKPELAESIFRLKQRSPTKPLILMAGSMRELLPYLVGSTAELAIWLQTAEKYLPGALTLVLPASELVPKAINPTNSGTIGIRIPYSALALEILTQTGALATTSANLSGKAPLETMKAIEAAFPDVFVLKGDRISEDEPMGSGLPSTVAQWTGQGWQILRQGSLLIK
jgi:L-threonylcarbamoyladenylate synthase